PDLFLGLQAMLNDPAAARDVVALRSIQASGSNRACLNAARRPAPDAWATFPVRDISPAAGPVGGGNSARPAARPSPSPAPPAAPPVQMAGSGVPPAPERRASAGRLVTAAREERSG